MKKLCLIILDGWGVGDRDNGNAVHVAHTPTLQEIERWYPKTALQASGLAVGLPWGESGNSEVGHLTIGAGFIPYQALPRISMAIKDGSFFENKTLKEAVIHVQKNNSVMHIMGLLTKGSVHAFFDHLIGLVEWAKRSNVPYLLLHLFTDGRDSQPQECLGLLKDLINRTGLQNSHIGTIMGRFYPMDRDNKWERIEKAYNCLTSASGGKFSDPLQYIENHYKKETTDEFILPGSNETIDSRIKDNDAVIFFNFREDSVRELSHAFVDEQWNNFSRPKKLENIYFATFTQYEENLSAHVIFPPFVIEWPLARVLSDNGFKQFHIAETEKYAHITYFLNGLKEAPYPNEERILVPSVSTDHFDDQPEMSAFAIKHHVLKMLGEEKPTVLMVNFANSDMVGHTGNFKSCIKAVETIDKCLSEIIPAALKKDWDIIITSDHGNVEYKINLLSGKPLTEHTQNPVPFYLIGNKFKLSSPNEQILQRHQVTGLLADIAPSILNLLEISPPATMTGQNILPLLIK